MISLISAQDAVNSSVADWGDVIGDEIHMALLHKASPLSW